MECNEIKMYRERNHPFITIKLFYQIYEIVFELCHFNHNSVTSSAVEKLLLTKKFCKYKKEILHLKKQKHHEKSITTPIPFSTYFLYL